MLQGPLYVAHWDAGWGGWSERDEPQGTGDSHDACRRR